MPIGPQEIAYRNVSDCGVQKHRCLERASLHVNEEEQAKQGKTRVQKPEEEGYQGYKDTRILRIQGYKDTKDTRIQGDKDTKDVAKES